MNRKCGSLWLALSLIACLATPSVAQTTVPKDQIPKNAPRKVRKQIEALYSENGGTRLNAVLALLDMGSGAAPAAPFLVGILGDDESAETVLTESGEGMTSTMQVVGQPGKSAVRALIKIGEAAVEPTIVGLKNDKPLVRERAAEALGELKDKRALAPLVDGLSDTDQSVRAAIVKALEAITGEKHGEDAAEWRTVLQK